MLEYEETAQVSVETLLIIGGAIVVATTVGLYLKGIAGQAAQRVIDETGQATQG